MFTAGVRRRLRAFHALAAERGGEDLHAHDYLIEWSCVTNALDSRGFAVDIALLAETLRATCAGLEGADLNALPFFASRPPSVENLAVLLVGELRDRLGEAASAIVRSQVAIWESQDAWASYSEDWSRRGL